MNIIEWRENFSQTLIIQSLAREVEKIRIQMIEGRWPLIATSEELLLVKWFTN